MLAVKSSLLLLSPDYTRESVGPSNVSTTGTSDSDLTFELFGGRVGISLSFKDYSLSRGILHASGQGGETTVGPTSSLLHSGLTLTP